MCQLAAPSTYYGTCPVTVPVDGTPRPATREPPLQPNPVPHPDVVVAKPPNHRAPNHYPYCIQPSTRTEPRRRRCQSQKSPAPNLHRPQTHVLSARPTGAAPSQPHRPTHSQQCRRCTLHGCTPHAPQSARKPHASRCDFPRLDGEGGGGSVPSPRLAFLCSADAFALLLWPSGCFPFALAARWQLDSSWGRPCAQSPRR